MSTRSKPEGDSSNIDFLWILLGVLYLTALIVLGLATLRKGHTVLFWVGIIFPLLWIVGALMESNAEGGCCRSQKHPASALTWCEAQGARLGLIGSPPRPGAADGLV